MTRSDAMRLLIAESDHGRYAELLADTGLELCAGADPEWLAQRAGGCPLWLGEPHLLAPLLRAGARPRWLQSTWAGITPLLAADLPRDYRLSRAVGIFGQVMAEYVLGYLLAHERRLLARVAAQAEGRWDARMPCSLTGRRVLIVGCGEIGGEVAGFLAAFGVELYGIASRPRVLEPFLRVEGFEALERRVAEADYVINLLPDTPATRDVYDAALFRRFRPEALFINAGRGVAVVDTDLVAALREGWLAGAVIDVCREEPLPPRHPFWRAPGLLLTGHTAAPTLPQPMAALFRDNLARYRAGQPLRGEVAFERGY